MGIVAVSATMAAVDAIRTFLMKNAASPSPYLLLVFILK
jgi:hypothetical protein